MRLTRRALSHAWVAAGALSQAAPDASSRCCRDRAPRRRIRAGILTPEWIAADAASQSDEGLVELAGE